MSVGTSLGPRSRRLPHLLAATTVALGTGLGLTACGGAGSAGPDGGTSLQDINEEGREDQGAEVVEDDVTEADIAQAPNEDDSTAFFDDKDAFLDEPVTVSGEIVEVLGPQAFVIGRGDQATLVTRPDADGVTLLPGYVAQVTGDVGTFFLTDVEADLGADLVDEDFAIFEDGPYIAASDVNLLNEN